MHLVMFDIDGTLVDSDGFDGELYARAVHEELGIAIDETWESYRDVTDSGILDELLEGPELDRDREALRARVRRRFVGLIRAHVASRPEAVTEIAGARGLLERLAELPGFAIAIATGGWRETAELKLAAVGIDPAKWPLATSSEAASRTRIMQLAERQVACAARVRRRTYFGDGAWDQRASAALGYDFVAVGTKVAHPVAFPDLTDHARILAVLDA